MDSAGRVMLPKALRDALRLHAGSTVDISAYGTGLRLVSEAGHLVATGDTEINDDIAARLDAAPLATRRATMIR